jgi:cell division septum initiation protein DivIVA
MPPQMRGSTRSSPEGSVLVATPPTATSGLHYSHGQPFDTVLRGYERRQVDDFVAKSNDEIIRLKEDLAEAQRQRRLATEHAEATERELRELQGKSPPAEPIAVEDSFGFRAEKLLRMADQEAADMRACATRDAQAVEAAARRRAEEQLRAAEAQAKEIRARASEEASEEAASRQKQVSQEAARLDRLYRSTKGEIQRLAELLNAEAQRPDPDGRPARADEPSSGTAANT